MENYNRDQRALSKSNKRDIEEIKADEELLAEINRNVVGVCTHKDCLKKAQSHFPQEGYLRFKKRIFNALQYRFVIIIMIRLLTL